MWASHFDTTDESVVAGGYLVCRMFRHIYHISVKLLSPINMLASASQCTSHSRISSVDCSLGDGIGVASLHSGVQGSTSGLSLLQALSNLTLFIYRLNCSLLSFLDFLLTRYGKPGVVFGLDCPGGGVTSDWFLEQAVGGDKNPVILPCIMVITQCALRGFDYHTCGPIVGTRVCVGNTGGFIQTKIPTDTALEVRIFRIIRTQNSRFQ